MSVKASVSITEQQNAFARDLVAKGRYSSISAVVQQGIEMLREENDLKEIEFSALKTLLIERSKGPFTPIKKHDPWIKNIITEKLLADDVDD